MRRDPATILAAHKMDSSRRDLYVEGIHDKAFLEWVFQGDLNPRCQVITVDFVDVPDVDEGGNRGRLIYFLRKVETGAVEIRGLIDADHERIVPTVPPLPENAWITDFRDLEAYVLSHASMDAALRAGCGLSHPDASAVLAAGVAAARYMAAIRLVSLRDDLKLPVGQSPWEKHLTCDKSGGVAIAKSKLLTALLQRAGLSITGSSAVEAAVSDVEAELSEREDRDVVHGKDFDRILTKQLAALGIRVDTARRLLFPSFDRSAVGSFTTLAEVGHYLAS